MTTTTTTIPLPKPPESPESPESLESLESLESPESIKSVESNNSAINNISSCSRTLHKGTDASESIEELCAFCQSILSNNVHGAKDACCGNVGAVSIY